jgi:hypothetical protein
MRHPYESAIAKHKDAFRQLGLLETSNSEYGIEFTDGLHTLTIGIERYYPLNLTIGITDSKGQDLALAITQEALDPDLTNLIRSRLRSFVSETHLDQKSREEMILDGSLEGYFGACEK